MADPLFTHFNPISAKGWKQKIQMDLKGADYNEVLRTLTNEGITIEPFYHQESFKSLAVPAKKSLTKICQTVFIANEKKANGIAKEAFEKGADIIRFIADKPFNITDLLRDFSNIKKQEILIILNFLDLKFISLLEEKQQEFIFSYHIDILYNFAVKGNWYKSQKIDNETVSAIQLNKKTHSILSVDASLYQNSGANMVQQISYALSHFNTYLNAHLINNNTEILVTFSLGSHYFFEIAKLRAFRYLFKQLVNEYSLEVTPRILVIPSIRNKTIYDYNVNLLRTTTECMSGILGGADIVSNTAYDTIYHRANEFGARIARNQLLILKEESYLIQKTDITKGSYYIEQLTYEIADKALSIFKDIEKNGGFIKQLYKGTIQRKIEESANKEQKQFDSGALVLLGTNKYPNTNDLMKNNLELYPFIKTKVRKTEIKPIIPKRLSEKVEQERLKKEK